MCVAPTPTPEGPRTRVFFCGIMRYLHKKMSKATAYVALVVLLVVATAMIAVLVATGGRDGVPPGPAPPQGSGAAPSPTPSTEGKILSWGVTSALDFCSTDANCLPGDRCVSGSCRASGKCSKCVPFTTTEVGDPGCLDFWDGTRQSQRLLNKVKDQFQDPKSSVECEYRNPHFELQHGDGKCSITYRNKCETK